MTLDISVDEESSEVVIIYDNATVLKVVRLGDDINDFRFNNFDRIGDEAAAALIKSFAKSLLLL